MKTEKKEMMIKPENNLELSIKALDVFGIEPNIIKSMLLSLETVIKEKSDLEKLNNNAFDLLKWMAECPYTIDSASVPLGGIDIAPKQVVGVLSLGYLKYKQLRDIVKEYKKI